MIFSFFGSREHIFDENAVAAGGVADEDVGDGADDLSVLNDRGAAHECGQAGTTLFCKLLTVLHYFIA